MRRSLSLTLLLVAALTAAATADAGEHVSTLADQRAVGITIYNSNLALVRDRRQITIPKGESQLALRDVSARMQPETALLQSGSGRIDILEQNFNYDLLTPQSLLAKYVGRNITVTHVNDFTGKRVVERARVLSAGPGGVVLQYANRIETATNAGEFAFAALPANLRDRPTLVTDVENSTAGSQDMELTYLTGGLSWKADYNAELSADDTHADIRGLITLQNQSGTSYRDATVQLVAGDVNVVRSAFQPMQTADTAVIGRTGSALPQQQSLLEYHLYTLGRRTTIGDNQSKQVELLRAASVPVTKSLELRGQPFYYRSKAPDLGTRLKVDTFLTFRNADGDLGIPLPAGIVRVYKRDSSGTAQFVGSDSIDHTPKNELVRLRLGSSFDVTANKKQTEFQYADFPNVYTSSYSIVLSNAKKTPETVLVVEPIPGDWTMETTSAPFEKSSSSTATWNLRVPPEGSTTLTYRVRVKG